jgi:acetyl esterase/lipase
MKAALDPGIAAKIACQILICPVIDNTATVDTSWATSKYSPWLTPSRMTWYRNMYFRSEEKTRNWDASPCFAPEEALQKSPRTFLAIAECDLLAPEAIQYGNSLRKSGVDVDIQLYRGATHSILILAG